MSRLGKKPVPIPEGTQVEIADNVVKVTGPKGSLSQPIPHYIKVNIKNNSVIVERVNDSKIAKSFHGLTRTLIKNMFVGVSQGYEKVLELVGTGYRVNGQGNKIVLTVGFSHPVEYIAPEGITLTVEENKFIKIQGIDKQKVGQVAAEIRSIRKPEPYKGKGIRYKDEQVRKKAGKSAKA